MAQSRSAFPIAMLVASPLCSAAGIVLTKKLVGGVDPIALLVVQLGASVAFLWLIAAIQHSRKISPSTIPVLMGLGALIGMASICTIFALRFTTASQASLIFASEPMLIVLVAWPILGERPTWPLIALTLLALAGVAAVANGAPDAERTNSAGTGLALSSTALGAFYTVWMRRLVAHDDPLTSLAVVQTAAWIAALLSLPFGADVSADIYSSQSQVLDWAGVAISGILLYGLGYWLYLIGLRRIRAGVAGLYLNLVPVFALGLAFAFLGEVLSDRQWIGAAATLVAVVGISLYMLLGRPSARSAPE